MVVTTFDPRCSEQSNGRNGSRAQCVNPEQPEGAGRSPATNLAGGTPMTAWNSAVMWDWS